MKKFKKHILCSISSSLIILASIFGTSASWVFWEDEEVPKCLIK